MVRAAAGILLDVSLLGPRQEGPFLLLRAGGDLDQDPRRIPWPLDDQVVTTAVVSGVVEQLAHDQWFAWWDELHRVMKPGGKVYLSGPFGGHENWGWLADPHHRIRVIEPLLHRLDPRFPALYERYTPRPWTVLTFTRVPALGGSIDYNAILEPLPWAPPSTPPSRPSRRRSRVSGRRG